MLQHQLPWVEVQQELEYGDSDIFNTVFTCSEQSSDASTVAVLAGLEPSKYLITVNATLAGSSGAVRFGYQTKNFSEVDMEGVLDCFKNVLEQLLQSPLSNLSVGEIDFVSELSCQKISEWNSELP
ncbi:hypothetical protein AbraCBS73388_001036, partial [Aspergillus brasiliensis]